MASSTRFEARIAGVGLSGRSGFLDTSAIRLVPGAVGPQPKTNVHAHVDQFAGVKRFRNGDLLSFEVEENPNRKGFLRAVRGVLIPRFEGVLSDVHDNFAVIRRQDITVALAQLESYGGKIPKDLLPFDDVFVHIKYMTRKIARLRRGMRVNFLLRLERSGPRRGRLYADDIYVVGHSNKR